MIDFLKTQYTVMDLEGSMETRLIAQLPLLASVTFPKADELYSRDIAAFREKMRKAVRQALWAGAYHDLIGPIKELQAKALYHARESHDVSDVREINARIDKLLTPP
jgi:hypothetical protein